MIIKDKSMTKEQWIQEAHSQIMGFDSNILYLEKCDQESYEENRYFKIKEIIKNITKQKRFLEDGIRLIQEKK